MASRRLIVEIIGDDASLKRALGSSAAGVGGFGDRVSTLGGQVSSVGKTLTTHLALPLIAVGAVAGKSAVDFQNSMELLHTQAGVAQQAVDKLSKGVLALAGPTATAPDELAKGIYHLASQGLRGQQAMDALKVSAEGAKLGQADLEDVTNALGATIVAKIGGVHSYGQAMGELNKIVGAGDMRMQDLADAMGTGLPASAKIAGVSLDQIGGALATFGDNNIRGAKAGTLLNSTLRIMSAPSKAAADALAGVGINATELGNKLRQGGLTAAIGDLKQKMDAAGLSATEQGVLLTRAFGGRQATGVKILLDEFDRLKGKVKEVGAGGSEFASDWTAYTKTTAYHLASMGAQMQSTGVTIGNVLLPIVAKLADIIGSLATKFQELPAPVRDGIIVAAALGAALGPVLMIIGNLTTAIGFLIANPLVLLIAGIVALVAALVAAVVWPDKLRAVLERMGLSAKTSGEIVADLQSAFKVVETAGMALVGVIRDNWGSIKAIITGVVSDVKAVITTDVAVIKALWDTFGGDLKSIARTDWDTIKGTIHGALTAIRGVVDVVTGLIHGDWSQVWKGIKEIVSGTLGAVKSLLHGAISQLGNLAHLVGTAIYKGIIQPVAGLVGDLFKALTSAVGSAVKRVASWVVGAAAAIGKGITDGILSGVGSLASTLASKLKGAAGSALSDIKGGLHIHSPSQVFADQVGRPIAEGILAGFDQGIAPFSPAMRQLLGAGIAGRGGSVAAAPAATSSAGGSSSGGLSIQHLEVNAPNYVGNRRELEDAVVNALSRFARRNGLTELRAALGAP